MKLVKAAIIAAMGLSVTACAQIETATRNAPFAATKEAPAVTQLIDVSEVKVNISRDLKVSEADLYYPVADIVWRGDARGDRYEQVGAIFEQSATEAVKDLDEGVKARVEIDLVRFHAITDKARYTVGGVHNMVFVLSVKDAETGVDLVEPRQISADLKALGGQKAIEADSKGITQKARITAHLTKVIRSELVGGVVAEEEKVAVSRNAQVLDATPITAKGGTATVY